jgi:hypothetical protein
LLCALLPCCALSILGCSIHAIHAFLTKHLDKRRLSKMNVYHRKLKVPCQLYSELLTASGGLAERMPELPDL